MNAGATINQSGRLDVASSRSYASGMDRDKFVRKQVKRGGWQSREQFEKFIAVIPCDCGKRKCKGWRVRWKFGAQRRREGNA